MKSPSAVLFCISRAERVRSCTIWSLPPNFHSSCFPIWCYYIPVYYFHHFCHFRRFLFNSSSNKQKYGIRWIRMMRGWGDMARHVLSFVACWCHQGICSRCHQWRAAYPAHRGHPDRARLRDFRGLSKRTWFDHKVHWTRPNLAGSAHMWLEERHYHLHGIRRSVLKARGQSPGNRLRRLCVGHTWECRSTALANQKVKAN